MGESEEGEGMRGIGSDVVKGEGGRGEKREGMESGRKWKKRRRKGKGKRGLEEAKVRKGGTREKKNE